MVKELLEQLNFTPNQIAVYLALFDLGEAKVGDIIKETGFHRNIIYRALDDLEERQLVFHVTKSGVSYFQATSPEPLLAEARAQERIANQAIEELSKRQKRTPSEVLIFTGKKGVQELLNKVLDAGQDLYLIGANGEIQERYPEMLTAFEHQRAKLGFERHHLAIQDIEGQPFANIQDTSMKFLPPQFSSPNVTWIFGDKIAHVLWEQPETIFFIHNAKIAKDYRKYFDMLWGQKVVTYSGVTSPPYAFGDIVHSLEEGELVRIMGIYEFNAEFRKEVVDFHIRRSGKGIRAQILLNDEARDMQHALERMPHTEIRRMEKGLFTPAVFLLYGDKTLVSLGDEFSFFRLESVSATKAFNAYFEHFWEKSV